MAVAECSAAAVTQAGDWNKTHNLSKLYVKGNTGTSRHTLSENYTDVKGNSIDLREFCVTLCVGG